MRRIFTTLIFFLTVASMCQAQRYDTEIYTDDEITVTTTLYGYNYTVLTIPQTGHTFKQPLVMDVYAPPASDLDELAERPLVLAFHNGNFLPPLTNGQISGTKNDSSTVEVCRQLAKRGFVAASVEYRDGWNPLAMSQPERALGLIQAAYRGVQDGRTAIRYMKKTYAEDGNPFGIDTTRIATWGNGTGGYLTLGLGALDDYNEIITTTNPPGKFLLDTDGDMVPETPMVFPPYHGDLAGKVLTINPDAAFGLPPGDTTNFANHVDYVYDHHLTIHVGGALGDVSWLADQTVPIISVQSIADQFAPYDDAILRVPTTLDPIVQVQGLKAIGEIQEANGMNARWKSYALDDAVTQDAMANAAAWVNPTDSLEVGHPYYEGGYSWSRPINSFGFDEGVVINWWNENDFSPPIQPDFPGGLPWNMIPHPSGVTFHQAGLVLNEGMSAEKSRANLADVMNYVIPRACVTLQLQCDINASIEDVNLSSTLVEITPNPSNGFVNVTSVNNEAIKSVEIFNLRGALISTTKNINNASTSLTIDNQIPGLYIMKIYMDEGFVTKKLVIE